MTRVSISKWGNSLAVRLPRHITDVLSVGKGSELALDVKSGVLVAKPIKKRPTLAAKVKLITPANRHKATEWGLPVGNEVW